MVHSKASLAAFSRGSFFSLCAAVYLLTAGPALGQINNPLIGIWTMDEGFQTTDLLFRANGRYQIDTTSVTGGFAFSDPGRYELNGQVLTIAPYDYFGEPQSKTYEFQLNGDVLTLTRTDFPLSPE